MNRFVILTASGLALIFGCSKESDNNNNGPTGPVNIAPAIQSIEATPREVRHEETTMLSCIATDADRDSLTYVWASEFGELTVDGPDAEWHAPLESGDYWVKVTVSDGVNLDVDSIQIVVAANQLPLIEFLSAASTQIVHGRSIGMSCSAIDLDGDIMRYVWQARAGVVQGSGANILWYGPQISGSYYVIVSVGDGIATVQDSLRMTILPNRPPEILGMIPNPEYIGFGERSQILCNAFDPDNDELTYHWNYQIGGIFGTGPSVSWQGPNASGSYWVTADVRDGFTSVIDTIFINVVQGNNPPNFATDPSPASGALHIDFASLTLRWRCTDPDGDPLHYDLFFGSSPPWGALLQTGLNATSFVVTGLNPDTQYYWGIVAKDDKGGESRISSWNFHTRGGGR